MLQPPAAHLLRQQMQSIQVVHRPMLHTPEHSRHSSIMSTHKAISLRACIYCVLAGYDAGLCLQLCAAHCGCDTLWVYLSHVCVF